jgi:hypothetical protein
MAKRRKGNGILWTRLRDPPATLGNICKDQYSRRFVIEQVRRAVGESQILRVWWYARSPYEAPFNEGNLAKNHPAQFGH